MKCKMPLDLKISIWLLSSILDENVIQPFAIGQLLGEMISVPLISIIYIPIYRHDCPDMNIRFTCKFSEIVTTCEPLILVSTFMLVGGQILQELFKENWRIWTPYFHYLFCKSVFRYKCAFYIRILVRLWYLVFVLQLDFGNLL